MLDQGVTNRTPGRSGVSSTSPNAWRTPTWPASITMTLDDTRMIAPTTVRSQPPVRSRVPLALGVPEDRRPAAAVNSRNAATRIAPPSMREPMSAPGEGAER